MSIQIANAGFRNVSNFAGARSDLNVTDIKADSVTANALIGPTRVVIDGVTYDRGVYIGYTPNEFRVAGDGMTFSLLTAPNLPAATVATDPNLLIIPQNILIESARAVNNGIPVAVVGATTFDIGTGNFGVQDSDIFSGLTTLGLNSVGGSRVQNVAGFNTPGTPQYILPDGDTITITNTPGSVAAGNVKVEITYLIAT